MLHWRTILTYVGSTGQSVRYRTLVFGTWMHTRLLKTIAMHPTKRDTVVSKRLAPTVGIPARPANCGFSKIVRFSQILRFFCQTVFHKFR